MPRYYIEGGKRLEGEIDLQGAKNSVLPILAATLLIDGVSVLHRCPELTDVYAAIHILNHLGCKCSFFNNTITVNASNVSCNSIPEKLMHEMRSSIVFLGAILSRCGRCSVTAPGGCELGPRPIDLHLKSLKKLGYKVSELCGSISCVSNNVPENVEIDLDFPSVGATENILLASAVSSSVVTLRNAAKEPEIVDLVDFLNKAGADISGAGTDYIVVRGVKKLCTVEHTVIADRIVAATYMSAAAITGGSVILKGACADHMHSICNAFAEMGCTVCSNRDTLALTSNKPLVRLKTLRSLVYPGFPTDAGPLLLTTLTRAEGTSLFIETIFESRFNYVGELRKLGADIKLHNRVAVVEGVKELHSATLYCTDLRGGAALMIGALAAQGCSVIDRIYHVERGYENIVENLTALGACIKKG